LHYVRTLRRLLDVGGVTLSEVRIATLTDKTFYAQAAIHRGAAEGVVDARPSDAINLALTAGAPIRVGRTVLDTFRAP
jgi:bifunctional DNase/RNase